MGHPGSAAWPDPLALSRLPEQLRWELAYGIRRAEESTSLRLAFQGLRSIVRHLARAQVVSLLGIDEERWPTQRGHTGKIRAGLLTFTIDELDALLGRATREHEFARDTWRLRRLGVTGAGSGLFLQLEPITQLWLREAVKRFLRWRLDTDHSPSGMHRDLMTLTRLSRALTDVAGPDATVEQFARTSIERFLGLLIEDGLSSNGRSMALASIRVFFAMVRQHDWLPGLDPRVGIYSEDMPRRTPLPPRALTEFVMSQLEDPANLERIPDERCRLLFPLLMQTGLRQLDARMLALDCVITDAQDAPYLRYFNHKMDREALVPITPDLATAIAARTAQVLQRHPDAAHLFAQITATRGRPTAKPPTQAVVISTMNRWLADCDVRDEHGQPVHVTAHQFRHTLGTRLINNDVPQEIVRGLLDHSSAAMTAHYARLHDTTVREHWERARKVDVHGRTVEISDDSPLADAAWMNHHLSRATMALPNGYCGLPLQQRCPHANACLTCPVFITTPEFLDQHREQLAHTQKVLEGAHARKQLRLVEINQRISDNLTTIITALETEDSTDAR